MCASQDGGGDTVFVEVELELLGAGGSHQAQSLGVGFLPDLDGGLLVGGGLFVFGQFGVGFSTIEVLPNVCHHSRILDREGPAGIVGGSGKNWDVGQRGERGQFVAHGRGDFFTKAGELEVSNLSFGTVQPVIKQGRSRRVARTRDTIVPEPRAREGREKREGMA